ncbi:MAG: ABC transporter permease [Roseivirga sp.]
MKVNRIVKSGFKILSRNKLRTFFMALGIIVGTVALFLSMSFGEGSRREMMSSIDHMFSKSSIFLIPGGGGMMSGQQSSTDTKLTLATAEGLLENVSSLLLYDPMQIIADVEVTYQGKTLEIPAYGGTENASVVWNRDVIKGEHLSGKDVSSSARVVLLGTKTAVVLFGNDDPIGKQIRLNNTPYEVKGILETAGLDMVHGMDRDNEVLIPISTMTSRLTNTDYVRALKFLVDSNADTDKTLEAMTTFLRDYHELAADEPDDFTLITPVAVEKMVSTMNETFSVFLPLVALIAMGVGGIVIAVLMLMNIKERSMEIGLRKALGARNKDVFVQFLIESSSIALVGAITGLGFGFFMLQVFAMHGKAMVAQPDTIVLSFSLPLLIGILAGILPANKAARLDPIVTLQA